MMILLIIIQTNNNKHNNDNDTHKANKHIIIYSPNILLFIFMNSRLFLYTPLISLHKYRSVYEHNILFRKPPLLGPPLSCAR